MRRVTGDLGSDSQVFSLLAKELDHPADMRREDVHDFYLAIGDTWTRRYLVPPARAASYCQAGGDAIS